MRQITLVLGGARSGKSRHAEALAKKHKGPLCYVATAEAIDDEMRARIARHRRDRGAKWTTIEAPVDLAGALTKADHPSAFILVECVTLWINNLLYHGKDIAKEVAHLSASLARMRGRIVLVSNEVGLSIVPENALAREFRDEAGLANQALAETADDVIFVAAGLPVILKRAKRGPRKGRSTAKGRGRRA